MQEFNFNSNESAEKLAEILQLAPAIEMCNIEYQSGDEQKIWVDFRYATDEETG